ncbi:MAG: dihydroorotase [Thermoplasmatota archaeon]
MIIKGTAYIEGELKTRFIGIEDEKIDFIKKKYEPGEDEKVLEWDGVILPAGIDMHVHFRDPGNTEKEDFFTGSRSAVYGGITTVLDMPNTDPPTDSLKRLKDKIKIAEERSCIDFGLYGLLCENSAEMCEETELFKYYMAGSTGIDKGEGDLEKIMGSVYEKGGRISFHCEDEDHFKGNGDNLLEYNLSRPVESEVKAIEKLSSFPKGEKQVCHVSSKEGLEATRKIDCTVELTPHHMFLSQEALLESLGKVNPPLRTQEDQLALWEAFERDEIEIIASDHAPHLEEEKMKDFEGAPAGIPGVETMYPLMLNSVSMGKISLSTVVNAIAENPAEILGIKKGKIEEGYYADLALVDFRENETIQKERLHSKAGWSPFEGFRGIFPRYVISHGKYVVKDREFVGEKGDGRYIEDI